MKPVEEAEEPYISAGSEAASTEDSTAAEAAAADDVTGADTAESEPETQVAELTAETGSGAEAGTPEEVPGAEAYTDAVVVPHGSLYPEGFDAKTIPAYSGKKYVILNDGKPYFTDADIARGKDEFELYSGMDELGRCGTAFANVCPHLMPEGKRGDISEIHPTGWKQKRYDGIVDADPPYLYNRSHLIAYKLAGENANIYNLITGTRYFNADGMSYVEDRVDEYVKSTGNHVLYRITPVFEGDELLARGVLMEAKSLEDGRIEYCEFIYNVQPGVYIDYRDGSNHKE